MVPTISGSVLDRLRSMVAHFGAKNWTEPDLRTLGTGRGEEEGGTGRGEGQGEGRDREGGGSGSGGQW